MGQGLGGWQAHKLVCRDEAGRDEALKATGHVRALCVSAHTWLGWENATTPAGAHPSWCRVVGAVQRVSSAGAGKREAANRLAAQWVRCLETLGAALALSRQPQLAGAGLPSCAPGPELKATDLHTCVLRPGLLARVQQVLSAQCVPGCLHVSFCSSCRVGSYISIGPPRAECVLSLPSAALPPLQNLGKLAEVTEPEHVSTQLLPLFTNLTQDGGCRGSVRWEE